MRRQWRAATYLAREFRKIPPADVNFGGMLQLAGALVERDPRALTLRLHWRALQRPLQKWRPFVHVVDGDRQVSSLDHEILDGRPPITEWEPADEGFEAVRLWLRDAPQNLRLRLGLYDPAINVRAAVLASTLPITDEGSAVWIGPQPAASDAYVIRFETPPLTRCRIVFESGLELAAYSVAAQHGLVWLRLKWIVRGRCNGLRFFGHLVPEAMAAATTLAQFDQDLPLVRRGPATAAEQNIVRAADSPAQVWLRVGVFRPANLKRLDIRECSAPVDGSSRCAFLSV